MQYKTKKIKLNSKTLTTYVFVVMIVIICIGMFFNAKTIGGAMLKRYKNYLPAEYGKMDVIKAAIQSTEKGVADSVIGQKYFIELNGFLHKINGNEIVNDIDLGSTIYKMDNGQLTFVSSRNNTSGRAGQIKEIHSKATQNGMNMLYVQAPFKLDKYNNKLPRGIEDGININTDNQLNALKEFNIPYIDLREVIQEEQLIYEDLFYNTDHHWKIETALWASTYVQQQLHEQFGAKHSGENTSLDRFESIKMEKSFLGSQGRRVGTLYGGIDDFSYFIPKFDTSYEVEMYSSDGNLYDRKTGDFEDTLVIDDLIRKNPVTANRYAVYFGRDWPLVSITNNKVDEGKILIIQDSFGVPFSAFMSLNFKHTDIIDLRHFNDQSIYEYLDENAYDVVLMVYGT